MSVLDSDILTKPWDEMTRAEQEEAYKKQVKAYMEDLRPRGLESLFIFDKYILEVEEGGGKVPLAQFHEDMCTFVDNNLDRKKLMLVPRGHLKSSLITVGYPLQRICKDNNVRILILSATWQMSVDFLTEIKGHLQKNQLIKELYDPVKNPPVEWSQDRITLDRSDSGKKGPTVWAAGIDTNLVGSHPDVIIMDDVVNRDNSNTKEGMEKIILRYKDALDLLEPGGQLIVIGTMWSDSDLYSWILNPENKVNSGFDIFRRPAFETDFPLTEVFKQNRPELLFNRLWPEKFSFEELKSRYESQGPYHFSSQYLLNPVPPEDADFKKEWFQYADPEDWLGKYYNCYMTVDPAISLSKEADFTAITIVWIDNYGNVFVRHTEQIKVKPNELINLIFFLSEQYHPKQIGIEVVAFQKSLQYALKDEMDKRRRYLPIVELSPKNNTKVERIKALQPLYASGKIYHNKNDRNLKALEDELLRFPRSRHDDLADALSMQLDLIVPAKAKTAGARYHHKYLYG